MLRWSLRPRPCRVMGRHLNPRPLEGYAGHLIMALNVRPFYKFIKKKKPERPISVWVWILKCQGPWTNSDTGPGCDNHSSLTDPTKVIKICEDASFGYALHRNSSDLNSKIVQL